MININTSYRPTIHAYVCTLMFLLIFTLSFTGNLNYILPIAWAESLDDSLALPPPPAPSSPASLPDSLPYGGGGLEPKIGGMHSMTITPAPQKTAPVDASQQGAQQGTESVPQDSRPNPTDSPNPASASKASPAPHKINPEDYIPLPMEKTLLKVDDFADWPYLNLLRPIKNAAQKEALISAIESDRAHASPQILFLSAQLLSDAGDHEHAALYLLAGQLRLSFDQARFPGKLKGEKKLEDAAKITAQQNKNKSADQALPNYFSAAAPAPTSAHREVEALGDAVSPPIFQWLIRHKEHMNELIAAARAWDLATPYAYELGYPVGAPVPFDQWPKILKSTRSKYFTNLQQFQAALGPDH